jgi:hypothetical protein
MILTGDDDLEHCQRLRRLNPAWDGAYKAAVGCFSIFAVNHWLFGNTHGGRVYRPLGDVPTGADAMALLASAAAGGCAACIVQLPGHAVALRQSQGDGEWFLLDSQAPGPWRLEGAEALVGSVWTLVQADGEGDFSPSALQVDLAGRGGMCQLVILGPLQAVMDDLSAAQWCHRHAVARLRAAATHSVSIVAAGDGCIKIGLPAAAVAAVLPTLADVTSLSRAIPAFVGAGASCSRYRLGRAAAACVPPRWRRWGC